MKHQHSKDPVNKQRHFRRRARQWEEENQRREARRRQYNRDKPAKPETE